MMTTTETSCNCNNLHPYSFSKNRNKRLQIPILVKGSEVFVVQDYSVKDYVDIKTGEIFEADLIHKECCFKEIDYGVMVMQRQYLLSKLRKEVREFALFVLKFRNKRRGITPTIKVLCQWYAELQNLRPDNIYRYIPKLQEGGILSKDNPDVMTPLFQISGNNTSAKQHMSEMSNANAVFALILIQRRALTEIPQSLEDNIL